MSEKDVADGPVTRDQVAELGLVAQPHLVLMGECISNGGWCMNSSTDAVGFRRARRRARPSASHRDARPDRRLRRPYRGRSADGIRGRAPTERSPNSSRGVSGRPKEKRPVIRIPDEQPVGHVQFVKRLLQGRIAVGRAVVHQVAGHHAQLAAEGVGVDLSMQVRRASSGSTP